LGCGRQARLGGFIAVDCPGTGVPGQSSFIITVWLGFCIPATGAVFSAFGARLPVFPAAHFAKVAKLALSGLKQGNFYASIVGKNFGQLTMSRRKTVPVADFETAQKTCRTPLVVYYPAETVCRGSRVGG